jgi:alkylation response protein AidB-like acyl-CoA dehydrogenase
VEQDLLGIGLPLEYAKNREQFDQPIADFQEIRWKLANMAMELDAARLLIYRAAANARENEPWRSRHQWRR